VILPENAVVVLVIRPHLFEPILTEKHGAQVRLWIEVGGND